VRRPFVLIVGLSLAACSPDGEADGAPVACPSATDNEVPPQGAPCVKEGAYCGGHCAPYNTVSVPIAECRSGHWQVMEHWPCNPPCTVVPCVDSGGDVGDAARLDARDAETSSVDATTDVVTSDVATSDVATSDVATSDAETGAPCSFNRECAAADRCECIDFDCRCRPGARGTGKNGVDTCTSGEDCASSICAEGSDGKSYCSDECTTDASCGPALPRCIDVAGLGRICARVP
jgi:hypothetical protein